jgi:hypothetical protein
MSLIILECVEQKVRNICFKSEIHKYFLYNLNKIFFLSGRDGNVVRSDLEKVLNDLSKKNSLSNFTLQIM